MAKGLELAMRSGRPVLAFGAWQPIGSPVAAVTTLVLTGIHRLEGVPLNPVLGCGPHARVDDSALDRPARVARVVASRQRARVLRAESGSALPRDFEPCDWDVQAQVAARDAPHLRLGLRSFAAVDRIDADGRLINGPRPGLGARVKRAGHRLPQLRVLPVRSLSDAALRAVASTDLLVVSLSGARGTKTMQLTDAVLRTIGPHRAALIVAEVASDVARFASVPVIEQVRDGLALACPPSTPTTIVHLVGQERVQYEEQFRFALPWEDLTPDERTVSELGLGVWRQRWRSLDPSGRPSALYEVFARSLSDLRRTQPSGAGHFNAFTQLLLSSERDAALAARHRFEAVLRETNQYLGEGGSRRTLLVVGSSAEEDVVRSAMREACASGRVLVERSRHMARSRPEADFVVVAGYFGPATYDGVLRARPSSVTWVVDPVEAYRASHELHQQGAFLHQAGLRAMADVIGTAEAVLHDAARGTRAEAATDHPEMFGALSFPSGSAQSGFSEGDPTPRVEEVDPDPDCMVVLLDGTHLRVKGGRRFDVLRSSSPHPQLLTARELQVGDEVLVVRSSYQQTLSELLLEELDRTTLRPEAEARRDWVTIVQTTMSHFGLTVEKIARQLRSKGIRISRQRIRSWLRDDDEETTPRDWVTFLLFARQAGVALPEEDVRRYFNAIKRWRVAHRTRGRAVVRAVRHAYFGGLSAADMARIGDEWGLGVRDLIEGCRVEEVEALIQLH